MSHMLGSLTRILDHLKNLMEMFHRNWWQLAVETALTPITDSWLMDLMWFSTIVARCTLSMDALCSKKFSVIKIKQIHVSILPFTIRPAQTVPLVIKLQLRTAIIGRADVESPVTHIFASRSSEGNGCCWGHQPPEADLLSARCK